jgi:hypothetical protein
MDKKYYQNRSRELHNQAYTLSATIEDDDDAYARFQEWLINAVDECRDWDPVHMCVVNTRDWLDDLEKLVSSIDTIDEKLSQVPTGRTIVCSRVESPRDVRKRNQLKRRRLLRKRENMFLLLVHESTRAIGRHRS